MLLQQCAGDSNLGCYAVSLGEWFHTLLQVVVPSSSGSSLEDEGFKSLEWWGTSHAATHLDVQTI